MVQSTSTSVTDAPNPNKRNYSPGASQGTARLNRRLIALTGFMGCGKSTVARLLARQIGWIHADLDRRIVERADMPISAIFAQLGEPAFRKIEHEELKRILGESAEASRPTIISLGGGTMAQEQNVEALRQAGCPTVWLDCQVDELLRRCSHITDRPLFRDEASFRQLYAQRLPFYELAEYRVESAVEPLRVVQNIIALGILEGVPT
ncbi:MAG TPA: shikimate kinase [Candidatus Acidoferrales bacterium]|nr:shikimate kinase [Candidatus Acidoferrales bacterium]